MKEFLKSIKLIDEFTIKLDCPKSYFVRALEQNVDTSGFELFESWSSEPPFKGEVSGDRFSIRHRRKIFDPNRAMTVRLNGTVTSQNEKSLVAVETGVSSALYFPLAFIIIVFLSFGVFASFGTGTTATGYPFLPAFALQMTVLLVIFYVALRRRVRLARRETEKEFLWIIRNYVHGAD